MHPTEIFREPHAHIQAHLSSSGNYGHIHCYVSLDSDKKFTRPGQLVIHSQIGTDSDSSIRAGLIDADERSYAHRVEHRTDEGLTAARLQTVLGVLKRFECSWTAHQSILSGMMLDLMVAAKIRHVLVNDKVTNLRGQGWVSKDQCRLLDLRKPADIVEIVRVVAAMRDQIWDTVVPAHRRLQLQREIDAQDAATA